MHASNEQDLSHSLIEEIIQMAGIDVYYIKVENLKSEQWDILFGENRFEVLRDARLIEMYPVNFENPYMGGDLYEKLGLTMNQQITFEVAYRRFEQEFDGMRPREGDYIFIPAATEREMNDMFRIMYVETTEPNWYQQGTILRYTLKCERATYGHQELKTGVEGIDYSVGPGMADLQDDANADNEIIQDLTDIFIDFSENNPFGKV